MLAWVDGLPATGLSLNDRGLAYGDGLFETIAVRNAEPRLLARHLARLEDGCRRLAIPLDSDEVAREIRAFSAVLGHGVAKLIVTRGEGQRGYAAPRPTRPVCILQGSAAAAYPAGHAQEGVVLFPCRTRLAEQPALAGLKHLNRLEQVLARNEWQGEEVEGLMRDCSGRVIEGVYSNLFLVRDEVLMTADLSRCGVAGVMRAELLHQAEGLGWPVQVRDIAYDELLRADEVFLCNSQYGIWPVRALDGHHWPVGPLTRKLQAIVRDRVDG